MIPQLLTFSCSEQLALNLCPATWESCYILMCFSWQLTSPFKDAAVSMGQRIEPQMRAAGVLALLSSH